MEKENIETSQQDEINLFKQERERLKPIIGEVGKFGGRPTKKTRILNIIFVILVVVCFIASLLLYTKGIWGIAALETGVLLLSLKFAYFLHNEAKVIHFEFWTLTSIEWRINELTKEIRKSNDRLAELTTKIGAS